MAATKYDFSIEQGVSFRISITYQDSNKDPVNISNYCARLVWTTDTGVIQVFSSDNLDFALYKFVIDGDIGRIRLMLPASITNSFNFGTAKYDLELKSDEDLYEGGGKKTARLLYGKVTLIKRNSRDTAEISCQ
jgi:hypothetical protein